MVPRGLKIKEKVSLCPFFSELLKCCDSGEEKNKKNAFVPYESLKVSSPSSYSSMNFPLRSMNMSTRRRRSALYEVSYALKSIHLNRINDISFITEMKNEIDILKRMDHPNIIKPIETFDYRKQLYVVMELCSGGDLYSRDPYTEEQACKIVGKIVSAVAYMHRFNIMHRDLKYENVLFENESPDADIKIIDFGLSKKYLPDEIAQHDHVGTIYTMAPEVLLGNYTHKADLWAIGVLSFMLLSSQMPFYGKKRRHVVEKIKNCQYKMRSRNWENISDEAKTFVKSMLQLTPDLRPEAIAVKKDAWLQKTNVMDSYAKQENVSYDDDSTYAESSTCSGGSSLTAEDSIKRNMMSNVHMSLKAFADYGKLKKLALLVVAHKSTSEEIGDLKEAFDEFDKDETGSISLEEFRSVLLSQGSNANDVENMFHSVDLDGTGLIHYTEFLAATLGAQGVIEEERLAEAFDRLDSNDSGFISLNNLRELFGGELSDKRIEQIIMEANINHDNKISYDEFLSLWYPELEDTFDEFPEHIHNLRDPRHDMRRKTVNLSERYLKNMVCE